MRVGASQISPLTLHVNTAYRRHLTLRSYQQSQTVAVIKIKNIDNQCPNINNLHIQCWRYKVRKRAKIRNRYNQAQHLTQDTNAGKVIIPQLDITNKPYRKILSILTSLPHTHDGFL